MRVALREPDSNRLLESWRWLVPDGTVAYVTLLGDLILERQGSFWFLESETAKLERIASSRRELLERLDDEENKYLGSSFIAKLSKQGFELADGQCVGFRIPTILGGAFDIKNVYAADPYERIAFLGDVNEQIKDLPDGQRVRLVVKS